MFEERRDARLVDNLGCEVCAAHRVHRWSADEFGEQFGEFEHSLIIAIPL